VRLARSKHIQFLVTRISKTEIVPSRAEDRKQTKILYGGTEYYFFIFMTQTNSTKSFVHYAPTMKMTVLLNCVNNNTLLYVLTVNTTTTTASRVLPVLKHHTYANNYFSLHMQSS
jgi:hypothetical protein